MAFAYFDRVKETSTTTGIGVLTLAGAVLGFQAFSAVYANNDTLHYVIFQSSTGAWEVGFGTWLAGNQLQRTTVLASSNANAAVNFAAGTKEVFVQAPASIPSLQGAHFFTTASAVTRDAIPAATLRLGALARLLSDGSFWHWTGSAWVSFAGFAPTGGAAGQTQVWNGSSWVAGALDLADPDSHTGTLGVSSGGTGLSSAGGTPNRVLLTADGSSWSAGLVDLATMVTGSLAAAALAAAVATSVLGRSANSGGPRADIQTTVDGQTLRRAAGVLAFGALDLADPDAVTNLLPGTNVDPAFGTGNVSTTGTLSAGKTALTPAVETSGSPFALRVSGAAHTTLAASTQAVDLDFNLARTVQFATGALAAQRAVRFTAPTYSFVGASTLTNAATVAIAGSPVAGTNATITNSYALWIESGVTRLDGGLLLGLPPGSGSGVASSAAAGNIRGSRGTFLSAGGTGFQISLRNNLDTADVVGLAWDSVNSAVAVGGGQNTVDLNSSVQFRYRNNSGTTLHGWTPTGYGGFLQTFAIDSGTASNSVWTFASSGAASGKAWTFTGQSGLAAGGLLSQTAGAASDSTGTCTGGAGTWQAGPATGSGATHIGGPGLFAGGDATGSSGTRTGGPGVFRSGTGATDDGDARLQRGNNLLVQLVKPSSGLVVSLIRTAALTATQMPANTGDGVLYLGDATTMPTTGFPVSGLILGVSSTLGLQAKGKLGVETTLAPHGDAGNTTKRRMIDLKTQALRTTLTVGTTTAASFDVASLNGQAVTTGNFKLVAHIIARGNGYASCHELMAYMDVVAGTPSVGSSQGGVAGSVSNGSPFGSLTIDSTGTTVRLRAAHSGVSGTVEILAFFEIMEFEP